MSISEATGEMIYTVNFRKAWITPQYRRTDRVINILREFAERHMKTDDIKIDQYLNRYLWQRGKRNPPRRVRIRMTKDETDTVVISLYEELKERESRVSDTSSEDKEMDKEKPIEKELAAATGTEMEMELTKGGKDDDDDDEEVEKVKSDDKKTKKTAQKPKNKASRKKKSVQKESS
jgi:large subunit ribosomal protein L31e